MSVHEMTKTSGLTSKKLGIVISGSGIFSGSFFLTLGILARSYYILLGSILILVALIASLITIPRKNVSKPTKQYKRYTKNDRPIKEFSFLS